MPEPTASPPLRELRGVVERITYQNPDNGYTVARLAPERAADPPAHQDDRLVPIVGTLPDLTPGEAIVAHGWWRNDAKHGWQFSVVDYQSTLPATIQGMQKYLGSGLVKGIGPVFARRIVDTFADTTFEVIDTTPERLTEVAGIGPIRAQHIAATWVEQRQIREVMTILQSYAVSTSLAVRIYKRFGDQSVQVLATEPYRLAREVWGIGFKTSDTIAQAIGLAPDAPARLEAGVLHALGAAAEDGHTLLLQDTLLHEAAALLGVEGDTVAGTIERLLAAGDLAAATPTDDGERRLALTPFRRTGDGQDAYAAGGADPGPGQAAPLSVGLPPPAARRSACRRRPAGRLAPSIGCWACGLVGPQPLGLSTPSRRTWSWSMRSVCWTCSWPTSSSRPSNPALISCSLAILINSPVSARATCWRICWPLSASR